MEQLDLIVITNAITDLVYDVPHETLEQLGIKKGFEARHHEEMPLVSVLSTHKPTYKSPAGSPANVGFSAAALGADVGIAGTLGSDEHAAEYLEKMALHGIKDLTKKLPGDSGLCYTLISPDGERTFITKMNLSSQLHYPTYKSKVVHTSAYEVASDPEGMTQFLESAVAQGMEVSIDLADPHVCKGLQHVLPRILEVSHIVFASAQEFEAAYGHHFTSYEQLPHKPDILSLKYGKEGSRVITPTDDRCFGVFRTNVVNANGAGDSYSAGFLFGYTHGLEPHKCQRLGTLVASKVVGQVSATLELIGGR